MNKSKKEEIRYLLNDLENVLQQIDEVLCGSIYIEQILKVVEKIEKLIKP